MNFPRQPTTADPSGDSSRGTSRPDEPEPALHVAGRRDEFAASGRDSVLRDILVRGDDRDAAAERRDEAADARTEGDGAQSALDRAWAGRDRDAAAVDRADLVDVLRQSAATTLHPGA